MDFYRSNHLCNLKNFQGGEKRDGTNESNLETENADVLKEVVEAVGNDLSLPQKDELKGVCAEEKIALENENSENKNPSTGAEASKKNKKKKKKAAPAPSEEAGDKKEEEVKKAVLGEIDDNKKGENAAEVRYFEMFFIFVNQLLVQWHCDIR